MKKPARRIETFEPCGPIAQMIDNETKNKARGAKTRLLQEAIADKLGPKYPKLLERFRVLIEESAA